MSTYAAPRPSRQVVMRKIAQVCRTPRSAPEIAKRIGSSVGSVHVLLHRMRHYGAIVTHNPGTASALHEVAR